MKITRDYKNFFSEIKSRIRQAQLASLRVVNKELIDLYWDIGKGIHEKQKAGWGKSIVPTLADELQKEFPGTRGYSAGNLWYMAQFYDEYVGNTILESLIREIGWTHNIAIFKKCKDDQQRQFYIAVNKRGVSTESVINLFIKQQLSVTEKASRLPQVN